MLPTSASVCVPQPQSMVECSDVHCTSSLLGAFATVECRSDDTTGPSKDEVGHGQTRKGGDEKWQSAPCRLITLLTFLWLLCNALQALLGNCALPRYLLIHYHPTAGSSKVSSTSEYGMNHKNILCQSDTLRYPSYLQKAWPLACMRRLACLLYTFELPTSQTTEKGRKMTAIHPLWTSSRRRCRRRRVMNE